MVRVGADTKEMERGLKSARAKMKAFGGQMRKIGKVAAVAGAAVVGAIGVMVKSYIKAGDEVHKMALRTGFSTESLSELKYAAEISGASLESLEKGVKKMSKTIVDAERGLSTYVIAFDQIGLKAEDLMKLSPEEQFDKIARAIANVENPTLRAAAAQEIFGRAGTQLLPLFAEGAEGLDKLKKKAHELGIVFDQEAADKAAKLTDAITTLKGSVMGVSFSIAEALVPALTVLAEAVTETMTDTRVNTGAMTKAVLGSFKFIAMGIQGLLLAWNLLKTGVLLVQQGITAGFVKIAEGLLWLAKLTPGTEMFYAGKLAELIAVLKGEYEDYRLEKEKGIDTMTNIIVKYEAFVATLNKAKEGLGTVKEALKTVGSSGRDMTGVLEQAQSTLESYEFVYTEVAEKILSANELLMKSWNLTSEAQLKFSQDAIANFKAMEGTLKGFVGAILGTLENWAIGEIIPKIMKALPFPINLLAVGGAIATIKAIFAGLKSFKTGGFIEKETIARLHPGEYVLSAPDVKVLTRPALAAVAPASVFHTYLTINTKTLDDRTIDRAAEKIFAAMEREKRRRGS